jgi:hypothetical protein
MDYYSPCKCTVKDETGRLKVLNGMLIKVKSESP